MKTQQAICGTRATTYKVMKPHYKKNMTWVQQKVSSAKYVQNIQV